MGTLKEQMAKVLQEWDKEDTQTTQEKTMEKKQSVTSRILGFIRDNPNIESIALRDKITEKHPDITFKNIASMLKQMSDANYLDREGVMVQTSRGTRHSFTYTVVDDEERKARNKAAKNKMKAMVDRAAMARAAKEAKREARATQVGISDLVPQPTTSIYNTKPTSTADDVINSLSVVQARELYDRLKQIFGG